MRDSKETDSERNERESRRDRESERARDTRERAKWRERSRQKSRENERKRVRERECVFGRGRERDMVGVEKRLWGGMVGNINEGNNSA